MATSVASAGPPLAAAPSPAPSAPITLVVSDLAPVTVTTAAPPSAASTPSVASAVSAASAASPTAVPAAVVAAASPGHAHPHPSATPSPRSSLPALAAAASAAHSQGTRSPRPSPTVGPPARPAPQQTSMPPPTLNGHVHQFAVAAQTPPPAAAQHWTIYTAPQQPPPPPQYQPHHHHQQPQQRQRQWSHDSRMSKPAIMDPPGQHLSSSAIQSAGFPSPNIDHARGNSKYIEDVARLTYAIHQSVGQSVRRAIRDNWEKCLLGSDFHQAFIVSVPLFSLSLCTPPTLFSSPSLESGTKGITPDAAVNPFPQIRPCWTPSVRRLYPPAHMSLLPSSHSSSRQRKRCGTVQSCADPSHHSASRPVSASCS